VSETLKHMLQLIADSGTWKVQGPALPDPFAMPSNQDWAYID